MSDKKYTRKTQFRLKTFFTVREVDIKTGSVRLEVSDLGNIWISLSCEFFRLGPAPYIGNKIHPIFGKDVVNYYEGTITTDFHKNGRKIPQKIKISKDFYTSGEYALEDTEWGGSEFFVKEDEIEDEETIKMLIGKISNTFDGKYLSGNAEWFVISRKDSKNQGIKTFSQVPSFILKNMSKYKVTVFLLSMGALFPIPLSWLEEC